MSREFSVRETRSQLADVINDAAVGGKTTYITQHGRRVAQLGPIEEKDDSPDVSALSARFKQDLLGKLTNSAVEAAADLSRVEERLAQGLDEKGRKALHELGDASRRRIAEIVQVAAVEPKFYTKPREFRIQDFRIDDKK